LEKSMSRRPVGLVFLALALFLLFLLTSTGHALARDLTFEERVAAQEAELAAIRSEPRYLDILRRMRLLN
jgi:hypothetical protein